MMNKFNLTVIALFLALTICSCSGHRNETARAHDHENHDHEGHGHENDGDEDHDHTPGTKASSSAEHDHSGDENLIDFPKEEAEKIADFAVSTVEARDFSEVILTSGHIQSAQGDEAVIVATAAGTVSFGNKLIMSGKSVSRGETLLTIRSDQMSLDNQNALFRDARAGFLKAESDYKRAAELVKDKIISERDFQQIKLAYEQAKTAYETLGNNFSERGKGIISPIEGYIKNINVKEGDYVSAGEAVATVSQNRRLVLQADVSQRHFGSLPAISSANFRTAYDNRIYDLSALNGRKISSGRSSGNSGFFIPVYFEFDNKGDVVSGAFVEVYLKAAPVRNVITVPLTALTEEQGIYYVYLQNCEDTYRKRMVTVGVSDGLNVRILDGLEIGERVVSKGAYYVKLASMSGAAPEAHNHSH